MSNGLTTNPGLSIPTGLSVSSGESVGNGLSFPGFGGGVGPVTGDGILLEGSLIDFLMLEDGTSFLLQETVTITNAILLEDGVSYMLLEDGTSILIQE